MLSSVCLKERLFHSPVCKWAVSLQPQDRDQSSQKTHKVLSHPAPACSPALTARFQNTPVLQSQESPQGLSPLSFKAQAYRRPRPWFPLPGVLCTSLRPGNSRLIHQDSARQALLPGSLPGNPQKNLVGSSLNEHLSHLALSSPGMASPSSPFLPFLQLSLVQSISH